MESGFIADYVANSLISILKRQELSLEYLHVIHEPELRLKYKQLIIRTLKNCLKLHHTAINENDVLIEKRIELTRCAFLKTVEQPINEFFDEQDQIIAEAVAERNLINLEEQENEKEKEKKKEEKKKEKEKSKEKAKSKTKDESKEKSQSSAEETEGKKQSENKNKDNESKDNAEQDEKTYQNIQETCSDIKDLQNENKNDKGNHPELSITELKNKRNVDVKDCDKAPLETSSCRVDEQQDSLTEGRKNQQNDAGLHDNKTDSCEQSTLPPQQTGSSPVSEITKTSRESGENFSLDNLPKIFEEVAQEIEDPLDFVQNRFFDRVEQDLSSLQNRNLSMIMNANRVLAVLSLRLPSLNTNIDMLQKWQLFFAGHDIEKSSNVVGHEHQGHSVNNTSFEEERDASSPPNNHDRKHRRAASEQNKEIAVVRKKHSKHSASTKNNSVNSDEMPCNDEAAQSHKKRHATRKKKHREYTHSGQVETYDFSKGLTDLSTEKAAKSFDFFNFQYSLTDIKKESEEQELRDLEAEWRATVFDPKYPSFLNFLFEWIVAVVQLFPEGVEIPWGKLPGYNLFMRVFITNYKEFSEAKREFLEWYKANTPQEAVNFIDSFGQPATPQSICWNAVPTYFSRLPPELQIPSFSCRFGDNSRKYYGCWETRLFDTTRTSVVLTTPEVLSALAGHKLLSTPCYNITEVVQAWEHIKNWFTVWSRKHKTIANGFSLDSIFSAMDFALDGESQRVAFSVIQVLEVMLDVFVMDAKIDLVCNYLLRRNFFKLFLHWDADVRSAFGRFLAFKIYHPVDIIIHPEHASGVSHHRMEQVTQNDIKTNLEIFIRVDGVIQKIRERANEINLARLARAKEKQEMKEAGEYERKEKEGRHENTKTKEKDKKEDKAKEKNKQKTKEKNKAKTKEKEKSSEKTGDERQDSLPNEQDNLPGSTTSTEHHTENEQCPPPNSETNNDRVTDASQDTNHSDEHFTTLSTAANGTVLQPEKSSQPSTDAKVQSAYCAPLQTWLESSFTFPMSEHSVMTLASPASYPLHMWEQWEHYCELAVTGLDRWLKAYPYPIPLKKQPDVLLPRTETKRPVWKK